MLSTFSQPQFFLAHLALNCIHCLGLDMLSQLFNRLNSVLHSLHRTAQLHAFDIFSGWNVFNEILNSAKMGILEYH